MSRPPKRRRVCWHWGWRRFSPDTPFGDEVLLTPDELEAIRLCDGEGLYHEEAAERMGVSRQTLGRILSAARKKVALALTQGHAIVYQPPEDPRVARMVEILPPGRRWRGGRRR